MGWMHDTLGYFEQDPIYRRYHHHELTFSLMYAFCENFVLPLVTRRGRPRQGLALHQDGRADEWQKLANLRALYAYMWAHPGKKLLFMGSELAQQAEWSHERSLDWHLLEQPGHAGIQSLVRDLNRLYREEPALWELDSDPAGFWWLEPNDADANVIAFARRVGPAASTLSCSSPILPGAASKVPPRPAALDALARGDEHGLGVLRGQRRRQPRGRDPEPIPWNGQPVSAELTLPPLAAVWLVPDE